MRNYGNFLVLLMLIALPACAGNDGALSKTENNSSSKELSSAVSNSSSSELALPEEWEELTHADWLEYLDVGRCDARSEDNEARLKSWLHLDERARLLTLTCELGAYQDAFHVYIIDSVAHTVGPVTLERPRENDKSGEGKVVRGALYKSDEEGIIELLYLSAATGACGWRALYPIEDVKKGGVIKAAALFGDEDCYNGVTVNDWPALE